MTPVHLAAIALAATLTGAPAWAAEPAAGQQPPADFKKVSELAALPDFIPGLGTLYVQPATLPEGPFLAYDRDNRLVSTVYMVPIKDLEAKKAVNDLAVGSKEPVDHVDMTFNPGHPGVEEPHYHIILWHIPQAQEARLAE